MEEKTASRSRRTKKKESVPPEYQERLVTIKDATVNTEDENTLWLLVQDIESNAIFRSPLSAEDIQKITGISRLLSAKELIDFGILLRNREAPVRLLVDVNQQEFSPEMILAKAKNVRSEAEIEKILDGMDLPAPVKSKNVSRFQYSPEKIKQAQEKANNE